jgi:methionine-rich copper-binding protein CopC
MTVMKLRHALTAGATTAGLLVLLATPADAHAEVQSTSPASGSTVHGTLTQVAVRFDEAVSLVPNAMRLTTDRGIPVNLESPALTAKGKVLSAQVQDRLAVGGYSVAWRVLADDGHLESSTFSFAVAAAGAGQPTGSAIPTGPPPQQPGEPIWPVLVAAGLALAGGVGAGLAVRRGLRVATWGPDTDRHLRSSPDHETLRLPM